MIAALLALSLLFPVQAQGEAANRSARPDRAIEAGAVRPSPDHYPTGETAGAVLDRIPQPCSAWHSQTQPPRTIRVRLSEWRIIKVPTALYTARVVMSEWHHVPPELRKAGALAVKDYAWFKSLHPRHSSAGCFDLNDGTSDMIYRVKQPTPDVLLAVRSTWHWRLLRNGRLFQTGFRTGQNVPCASDIDHYHLFARSASKCARAGWTWRMIVQRYYAARLVQW